MAANAVLLAVIAGLVYFFWPTSLGGCSTLTIVSGHSMDPTYSTGDLVWSRCGEAAIGDIVVYTPPDTDGARVIHRIIGGDGVDGWVLQGDNNDFIDPWSPDDSLVVGVATVHVPRLGNLAYVLANPYIWGSLLLIATAIYLWPRPDSEDTADAEGAEDTADTEPSDEAVAVPTLDVVAPVMADGALSAGSADPLSDDTVPTKDGVSL